MNANTHMLVDSHAHFDHLADDAAVAQVIARATAAGVSRIVAIGGNEAANACSVRVARSHRGNVSAAVGFDRDQAVRGLDEAGLRELLSAREVVAVGEIGLDYHYDPETRREQLALFERMLAAARDFGKPVVVHSREAEDDTLDALSRHVAALPDRTMSPGVLHCFTGTAGFASRVMDLGMMIGFSGIITFKNAGALREVAAKVPDERLLIETDSPYLAPVPHRGRPNEPAWVSLVADELAKIRNDTAERIAHITTHNALRLFKPDGQGS